MGPGETPENTAPSKEKFMVPDTNQACTDVPKPKKDIEGSLSCDSVLFQATASQASPGFEESSP